MNHDLDSQIRSIFWLKRAMNGAAEPIKDDILRKIDSFNKTVSDTGDICQHEPPRDSRRLFDLSYAAISVASCIA